MTINVIERAGHEGWPVAVEARGFVFLGGCDGNRERSGAAVRPELAGDALGQCELSYGEAVRLLECAGLAAGDVARMDHFTSSQDWLDARQVVRGRVFGRPAPSASTGVAARMLGINMLTTALIASQGHEKKVVVRGADYGLENVENAVSAGPLLFLSGCRGRTDRTDGTPAPEETTYSFAAQARNALHQLAEVLDRSGSGVSRVVRLDVFLRDVGRYEDFQAVLLRRWPEFAGTVQLVGLPLGARGELEITALAAVGTGRLDRAGAADPAGSGSAAVACDGFAFVGGCRNEPSDSRGDATSYRSMFVSALRQMSTRLELVNFGLDTLVRLDVFVRDPNAFDGARSVLYAAFGDDAPVVVWTGADPMGGADVSISGIAVRG